MDNKKKRDIYLIVSIISGSIFVFGIGSFVLYIFINFFRMKNIFSNFSMFERVDNIIPIYIMAAFSSPIFKYTFNKYKQLNHGINGEESSQNTLSKLPSTYTVLSNIPIECDGKKSEIDNLVISPKGIVIVETKNYNGIITGSVENDEWSQTKTSSSGNSYTNTIKNPIKQLNRQIYILSQILNNNGIHSYIHGFVYMAGGKCLVESDKVLKDEKSLLTSIINVKNDKMLSNEEIQKIITILKK